MHIYYPKDCGNAPKKMEVVKFLTHLHAQDIEYLHNSVSSNFMAYIFTNSPQLSISRNGFGLEESLEYTKDIFGALQPSDQLQINSIITHGKHAACEGKIIQTQQSIDFAYFFEFISPGKKQILSMKAFFSVQSVNENTMKNTDDLACIKHR